MSREMVVAEDKLVVLDAEITEPGGEKDGDGF
jgi:hypothetical protein